MISNASNFMEPFSSRNSASAKLVRYDDSVFLSIKRPITLAAFFAFCSGQGIDTRVFLRGYTKNYDITYPSLFRGLHGDHLLRERTKRWCAYKYVLDNLRKLDGRRWRRTDLGAFLQHYGVKTPWLDVVRNLYSAIWFATHELRATGLDGVVVPTNNDYGWISFFRRKHRATGKTLRVKDISAHHSSTHLRPHAQHGGSLAMQTDNASAPNHCQDFNTFRIAQIRIPNTTEWKLSGYMASNAFMFPSRRFDGSLRLLITSHVQSILDDACEKFSLPVGSLGTISSFR